MKDIFAKRRRLFRQQCLHYLRYVFNDHFVLFLMIGLGFLMVQYRQLLDNLPKLTWPLHLFLILLGLVLAFSGSFNAYLEKPDQLFLLAKEEDLIKELKKSRNRGFLLWSSLQFFLLLLFFPLALALSWPVWLFVLYLSVSLVLKYIFFAYQFKKVCSRQKLFWQRAIDNDVKQKQSVLKFFSLFTQVKGVTQAARRRAYLDVLLTAFSKKAWPYLFARTFIRTGDYLGLGLRLLLISLSALIFIRQELAATAIVLLMNYLLLFQMLALYTGFDYQYLTQLYPLRPEDKKEGLKHFLTCLLSLVLLMESLLGIFLFQDKVYLLILIVIQLVLNHLYLPYKIKKLID